MGWMQMLCCLKVYTEDGKLERIFLLMIIIKNEGNLVKIKLTV
jgi:hypothetical protein